MLQLGVMNVHSYISEKGLIEIKYNWKIYIFSTYLKELTCSLIKKVHLLYEIYSNNTYQQLNFKKL